MGMPYTRAKKYGSGGGLNLAALFGALGGGEVIPEAVEEDVGIGVPVDTGKVRFKPKNPVRNVLSGGEGSRYSQELNREQLLGEQESTRRLGEISVTGKERVRGAKELGDYEMGQLPRKLAIQRISAKGEKEDTSEINQNQLQREMYIKDSGKFPEDDIEQFTEWQKNQYELSRQLNREQSDKSKLGQTVSVHGRELENLKHPFNLQSTINRGAADVYKSSGEEYEAQKDLGILPYKKAYEEMAIKDAVEDEPITRQLNLGRMAHMAHGSGVLNLLTGVDSPSMSYKDLLTQQLLGDISGKQKISPKGLSPGIGATSDRKRVYDPVSGMYAIEKPSVSGNRTSAPVVSPKPFSFQAPSGPFATTPVNPIGTGRMMIFDNNRQELIQKLTNMQQDNPGLSGMPSGSFDQFSTEELESIYQRMLPRFQR